MRITQNITSQNALYNLQQGRAKLDKLQEQEGSQANINRPSDDPIGTSFLLSVGDQLKAGKQYASNISKATTFLNVSSTALSGMASTMATAKTLIGNITSGSTDATVLANVVSQLKTLKGQLVDYGNTQLGNQYVFGGANAQKPFDATTAAYTGDETALSVQIDQSANQQMNVTGNQILTGNGGSTPYGTTNILQTFDDLIAAVGANNISGIQAGATALENGADQITQAQTDVAARITRLDSAATMITNSKNTLETAAGNIQNVDNYKLAIELTNQQTAFQASLSATAKVTQMSLLDYLG